jgi:hypothetical protein
MVCAACVPCLCESEAQFVAASPDIIQRPVVLSLGLPGILDC